MSEGVLYNQDSIGGGEVMEVMMTGGDGSAMNEETLAQVVNMLQMEGQLTAGGNHTIIIRQPGTDDIQMIQATSNDGEVVITKASAADIQTLQSDAAITNAANELINGQQGQVMMVDETGNLVEGVVQLSNSEQNISNSIELGNVITSTDGKSKDNSSASNLLSNIIKANGNSGDYIADSKSSSSAGSTISATGSIKQIMSTKHSGSGSESVVIKVDTKCVTKVKGSPFNTIKISTVTGTQKYQAPKFHKCEACVINFVSKIAYMNHMENCTKQKKLISQENAQYSCVFCNNKFNTRVILMQHVQDCQKAKESKISLSKSKLANAEGKIIRHGTVFKQSSRLPDNAKKIFNVRSKMQKELGTKKTGMIFDLDEDIDNDLLENDFDSEDEEKDIIYDDDEDINDEDFEDDNLEESVSSRKSQKHLGPIILNGLFKCRDCNRTFAKEHQYNRHVRACTMAPLNAPKIDNSLDVQRLNDDTEELPSSMMLGRKKRGRPTKSEENSPKRPNIGPKIVSVDPKKVVAASLQGKFLGATENDFRSQSVSRLLEDGRKKVSKFAMKGSQKILGMSGNNVSKIVKVSPMDNLIKKSGRVLLSKINQQKTVKILRENPICGLCGDKFKSNEELGIHIQMTHSDELLNLRDLLDGKRNLCSTKCPLCELHFNPNSLLFHLVSFHSNDLQSAQDELLELNLNLLCPYCNSINVSQELMKEHLATKHFDKIVNRPTPSVSPVAIDIKKLLEETTNGTNIPVNKQEKVLCPDCNLFISSSYFSHHKCAAEVLSPSEKKFVCSEDSCVDISFFKIDHLLTHFIQGHHDLNPCLEKSFENLSHFLEWLKEEEMKAKMKYTKCFQRLKHGKLCCVWICHQFHNAMRDSNSFSTATTPENLDKSTLCYSRIQVETSFSISTARYDATTNIKYFSNHVHKTTKSVPAKTQKKEYVIEDKTALLKDADKVAFTNTDELKSLLDDSNSDETTHKEQAASPVADESSTTDLTSVAVDVHPNDVEMTEPVIQPETELQTNSTDITDELADQKSYDEEPGDKTLKVGSTLVSMTDSDEFLLEKMLGEHDSNNQVPDNFLQESTKMDSTNISTSDMSCLMPADENMPSDVLEALDASEKQVTDEPEVQREDEVTSRMEVSNDEEKDSDIEESTYVLPADLEEWHKLYQLVRNNLTDSKLTTDELAEANKILSLDTTIAEEPVEKQVEVFTKLCSLANVHL